MTYLQMKIKVYIKHVSTHFKKGNQNKKMDDVKTEENA